MLTLAARDPEAPGVNVTEIEQDAPAAIVLGLSGHVVVLAKSEAFAPVTAVLVIVSGALPVFVSVAACAALVVPTACEGNVRLAGLSVTWGAGGGEEIPARPSAQAFPWSLSDLAALMNYPFSPACPA